ncbi:MAG TPA: acetyl-CoA carboxylase biotin carboxylase subunit [Saprospiraceae bacterium]|nr:acetyl-CoA carboxylase biotin carboxylase subunit [Saprospiraceae bacterium]HQV66036.1 acetyl-CoA carboxylase biotin carboxylase subunit [Saprospiraceae bacterium]HQV96328.1 acetyl-CoA carboxylase biotin carboxylase subunit [Saprospiraceae bacterium]
MEKVLVANRGEIACRVIRTLKKMGITSVAVYSDADEHALHVKMADEAYHLGPSPSNESYLRQDKLIKICLDHNIDAVHPGYGFLSENSVFALKLQENNIKLIGPSAFSMDIMGDKLSAKDAVKDFGIPMVPGTDYAISDIESAREIARKVGYPVLVKASAGGGGKGMKLVTKDEEFADQMQLAINEATSSFGNGAVFIEKFVTSPRHIEIQVLADSFGNTVYLFERECSIQRRHQKVVEEAPSIILTPEIRKAMGEAAVNVAKAAKYEGAGTVEFLMDNKMNFYFLEMNTRLQVEHPVTEMITGLDLVEQQIKIAMGEKLAFTQEDLKINGHAIELRVYAEDPYENFVPSINILEKYRLPEGEGIRVDNGYREGDQVPIYYDPMLAKLTVHATTRKAALKKMLSAIGQYEIEGIASTLDFGAFVMAHPDFISGNFDTNFVNKNWNPDEIKEIINDDATVAAWIAKTLMAENDQKLRSVII